MLCDLAELKRSERAFLCRTCSLRREWSILAAKALERERGPLMVSRVRRVARKQVARSALAVLVPADGLFGGRVTGGGSY